MVQRIQKFTTLAVRQSFMVTANQSSFFWNNDKGVVSLYSSCSASGGCRKPERATPFLFIMLNFFRMRQPEKNCGKGNNSTCTATNDPRKGLPELTEILSDFLFDMPDFDETREALDSMFFDAMTGGDEDDFPSQQYINKMFWCKKDLDTVLNHAQRLEEMRKYIYAMRDIFRNEKAEKTELPSAKMTLV